MSDLTRHRFAWLDALARHAGQPTNVFRLAYLISGYVNRRTGDAWPGQERLARELGVTVRTIRTCSAWLLSTGYLDITAGRGRGRTHRYRLRVPSEIPKQTQRSEPHRPAPRLRPRSQVDGSFEAFWQTYPRKIDKAAARRVYESVLRAGKATAAELLDGAQRYAQERAGHEPRYTKHPKTWLNAESWRNEPENLTPTTSTEAGGISAVRGILGWKH
jgi:hypothetical protein